LHFPEKEKSKGSEKLKLIRRGKNRLNNRNIKPSDRNWQCKNDEIGNICNVRGNLKAKEKGTNR